MNREEIYRLGESLSGLEFLKVMIASGDATPMGSLLHQRVVEAGDGYAVVEGVPDEKFYNTMGRVHGGFAATLIDTALGAAVMTKMAKATGFGTIELKVNFVRKIDVETGLLTARSTVIHAGRTMFTAEVKVTDRAGLVCAHGSGTFLVYPK